MCGGKDGFAADLRDPAAVLADPAVRGIIDIERPVAVLLAAVLHFVVNDREAAQIVADLRERLAPGSYLVLSHVAALPDAAQPARPSSPPTSV